MNTIPIPILVVAKENHIILLEFNDGVKGDVNLSHLKSKGVFSFWDIDDNFSKVFLNDRNEIAWNEEIEIDSTNCYMKILNNNKQIENASR